jgi:hypothetical protein
MDEQLAKTVWGVIGTVLGITIGGFWKWLTDRNTQTRLAALEKALRDVLLQHADCRVENALLKHEIAQLKEQVSELRIALKGKA